MANNSKLGKYVLTYSPHDYSIIVCKDKLFPPHYSLDDYTRTLYDFTVDMVDTNTFTDDNTFTRNDTHDALNFVSPIFRRFPHYYNFYLTITHAMEAGFLKAEYDRQT